jgi:hypothetical protein
MPAPEATRVPRYVGRETPALGPLRDVAAALGPLTERVVFIGGAVAPLLQTEPTLPTVRPTKDVDGVAVSSSYPDYGRLQDALRARGFVEAGMIGSGPRGKHAHRWRTPTGGDFDLVPAGDHLGGTGSPWDAYALESAVALDLRRTDAEPALVARHVSAVAFLALKWAAYDDRGRQDKYLSHDLEDILALVASRPALPAECAAAPADVRAFIVDHTREFLDDPDADELIDAQLGVHGSGAVPIRRTVRARLAEIAAVGVA